MWCAIDTGYALEDSVEVRTCLDRSCYTKKYLRSTKKYLLSQYCPLPRVREEDQDDLNTKAMLTPAAAILCKTIGNIRPPVSLERCTIVAPHPKQ